MLVTGRMVGAEALLRWRAADGKFVPSDKFIPVAESSGLIRPIGEWVLRRACRHLRGWCDKGLQGFRIAVNVSIEQFRMPNFTDLVRSVLLVTRTISRTTPRHVSKSLLRAPSQLSKPHLDQIRAEFWLSR